MHTMSVLGSIGDKLLVKEMFDEAAENTDLVRYYTGLLLHSLNMRMTIIAKNFELSKSILF